jgi:hypothetical protein
MKSLRILSVVLISLSTMAFAQSDAQKSFAKLKSLAGTWEGAATVTPQDHSVDSKLQVSFRVASSGNSLMHEMGGVGGSDDPLTVLYVDGDRLLLTHYCDAGNRPRMVGTMSPDGKTLEFDFLDITGSTEHGHMQHAVFTFLDENHHTEDWTFILKGDKPVHAHIDLQRKK